MQKLITGLHHFQNTVFHTQKALFTKLADKQTPDVLFITCSDSRVVPNLITQTEPGDLFVLRNAGNLVPPLKEDGGGEAATIEYALTALGVKDIIICGHTNCGAIQGLLKPELLKDMPFVSSWLKNAQSTKKIVDENYTGLSNEDRENVAVQENVLVQIENLKTLPVVAAALRRGEIQIHAWIYKMEDGKVFSFDSDIGQFTSTVEENSQTSVDMTKVKALKSV